MTPDQRVASLYDSRFLRSYARGKLNRDPVYAAVFARLPETPLLDLGCGIGLLSFYLRERGFASPVLGVDHDPRKIDAAAMVASRYEGLTFRSGDVRDRFDFQGSVIMLDLLHYFDDATQVKILHNAVSCLSSTGVVIIRDALRDGTWRYRATHAQESFARAIRWLRAERLNFPARETLLASLSSGFTIDEMPLWGRTPFNNYLFVVRRMDRNSALR